MIRCMAGTVDSLGKQSQRIGEIVEVITDIAERPTYAQRSYRSSSGRGTRPGCGSC